MSANRVQANGAELSAHHSAPESSAGAARSLEVPAGRPGCCRCLPAAALHLTFTPDSLERLYQNYFRRQRQENLRVLGAFAALFNGYVIATSAAAYSADKLALVTLAAAGLLADAGFYAACRLRRRLPASPVSRGAVPYALWLAVAVHVLCYAALSQERWAHASGAVGWQAFFSFCSFLALPLDLVPLLLLTGLSCGVHTLLLAVTVAQRLEENLQGPALIRQVVIYGTSTPTAPGRLCREKKASFF